MQVYIEVVLFNNFAVDLTLILMTTHSLKLKSKWWQIALALILGMSVAVAYPLCPRWAQILCTVLLAPSMTAIFASYQKFKQWLLATLMFYALTFMLAGTSYFILKMFKIDIATYWISGIVFLSVLLVGYSVRQFVLYKRRKKIKYEVSKATLKIGEQKLNVLALYDSGNQLVDRQTGKPVVVLSKKLGECVSKFANRKIQVKTVAGVSELPILDGNSLDVQFGKHKFSTTNFLVAVSEENYSDFDLILHETMREAS